jgi:hypothetical protein
VTCLNNEAGFTPDDVEGICEVGGSKKQGKAGFTGEKCMHISVTVTVTVTWSRPSHLRGANKAHGVFQNLKCIWQPPVGWRDRGYLPSGGRHTLAGFK